jgi:hypothetical protein
MKLRKMHVFLYKNDLLNALCVGNDRTFYKKKIQNIIWPKTKHK